MSLQYYRALMNQVGESDYKYFSGNTNVVIDNSFMVNNDFTVELTYEWDNTHSSISTLFSTHAQYYFWINIDPIASGNNYIRVGTQIGGGFVQTVVSYASAIDTNAHKIIVTKSSTTGLDIDVDNGAATASASGLTGNLDTQANQNRIGSYLSGGFQYYRGIINKVEVTDDNLASVIGSFDQANDYENTIGSVAATISGASFTTVQRPSNYFDI